MKLEKKLAILKEREPQTLVSTLGIEFIETSGTRCSARMEVGPKVWQPMGLLHGGATVALAESVASVGGWLALEEENYGVVGMEINANHLRPVHHGTVRADGTPLHQGKTTQVWEVRIVLEPEDKLISISRCTLAVVPIPVNQSK